MQREWILVGDGAFACFKLAHTCIANQVTLISRLRLDASLFEMVPDNLPAARGRAPTKGKKIKQLKDRSKIIIFNGKSRKLPGMDVN